MSIQQYGQTGAAPAVTQEQRAAWVQLKKDRDQLSEQVGVLERGHQDLQRFLLKARRNSWIACTVVSLCTAAAWFLDASYGYAGMCCRLLFSAVLYCGSAVGFWTG